MTESGQFANEAKTGDSGRSGESRDKGGRGGSREGRGPSRGGRSNGGRGGERGRGGKGSFGGGRRDGKGGRGERRDGKGGRDDRRGGSGERRGSRDDRRGGSGDRRGSDRRGSQGARGDRRPGGDRKPARRTDGRRDQRGPRNAEASRPSSFAPNGGQGAFSPQDESGEQQRAWTPNRERVVRSKKEYDAAKVERIVGEEGSVYRGELDPREKDPNKKYRSITFWDERERAVKEKAEQIEREQNEPPRPERVGDFREFFEESKASPGRLAALYVTNRVRRRKAYAQEVLEATVDRSSLSSADRAFATLLTFGVVSTAGALDAVINRCIEKPSDLKNDLRDALRISTYEIVYLRKAPHAAVDQGVELARAIAPSASRLANAVLHRVLEVSEIFPFDDPRKSMEALALTYGFPTWLAQRLVEDMGAQAAIDLMRAANEQAPVYINVNALKADDADVIALFEEVGAEVEMASAGGVEPAGCYRISNARAMADGRIRRLFSQGKILVSDAAAQAIAACTIAGECPESLLEVGAGRGTKTIMLQSAAYREHGRQLNITPMDTHGFKMNLLKERAEEYGIEISDAVVGNATRLDSVMPDRTFQTIFIDAPCSGLGTLRRHHEIRWRITPESIEELANTGLAMLKSAASHVEVGGHIVYATCTVTYAENNGVVKRFLESEEGANFTLAPINGKACFASQSSPGSSDAHFAAKFVRKA